jgi:hypothetical protein
MEDITCVICEDELVLDVVLATLQAGFSRSVPRTRINTPNLCCGVECNLLKIEIKSVIRNENVPAPEFPLDHVYISLDSR